MKKTNTVDKSTTADDDRPDPPLKIARRDGGMGLTINANRKKEFERAFAKHGCTATLFELTNKRMSYWRVEDNKSGAQLSSGFDIDLDRALRDLGRGLRLEFIDLLTVEGQALTKSDASGAGGPFCVVCDTAGGLPCPTMVTQALKFGIKLAFPANDVRIGPAHVHPGRCRKRLRQWLDAATQSGADRVLRKHE